VVFLAALDMFVIIYFEAYLSVHSVEFHSTFRMIPPRFASSGDNSKLSGAVHSYRICGLSVASDIALPGIIPGAPKCEPQVTIRRGAVPESLDNPRTVGPTWQIAGKQFLLSVPNVARFLLKDGDQIVFASDSKASVDDIPIFLIGTVFGILLHQREQIVLHASAVEVDGKAIVFCGASGAGKSTLAAALVQRGYRLVTDDVCAITLSDGSPPLIHSDGRQLKLWAEAIEKLGFEDMRTGPVRRSLEKFYIEAQDATTAALPVAAVYILSEARLPYRLGIERINVVDGTVLLHGSAYRPLLVTRLQQKEQYFFAAAHIANNSGVFLLRRPFDFAAMPDVISWLESHWRELELAEKAA
jgi:hypothetical protein